MVKIKNKAVSTVAMMMGATVIAKLLGMLRGVLLVSHYGTGEMAAAFSAASRIPLSFFDLLFSAAILGCFIPVYNSFGEGREREADRFACLFYNVILLLTGVLTLLGVIFAEPVIAVIAGGLDAGTKALAATLLRIMFPMIIFTGAAYTLVGVMQSKGRYLLPAVISAVSNAAVILYFVFLDGRLGAYGIYGLAAAYLVAWLIQLLTLAIPLARSGFKFRALLDFRDPDLRRAVKMAPPIMIGSWLAPIGAMSGTFFASYTAVNGALTIFDTTNNTYIIIVGTLVYSICNYTFPQLSRLANEDDGDGSFARTVKTGLLSVLFIVLPFMFAAAGLAGEGISVLYQHRAFTAADAAETASALRWMLAGMPAFAVIEVMSRTFYAKKEVRAPMWAALAGTGANITASALLIRLPLLGVGAVTAANAIGQWAAAICLLVYTVRRLRGVLDRDFVAQTAKMLLCGAAALAVIIAVKSVFASDPFTAGAAKNIVCAIAAFMPAAAVYLGLSRLLRVKLKY